MDNTKLSFEWPFYKCASRHVACLLIVLTIMNVAGSKAIFVNGIFSIGTMIFAYAVKLLSMLVNDMRFIIRLGLNVALTHQNRSYCHSENKANVEAQKRKQRRQEEDSDS